MDQALLSNLHRWFAVIELADGDVPPSVLSCLGQLVELLDILHPSRMDRRRSSILQTGHGWTVAGGVDVHLAHDGDEDADLHVVVGRDEAIVAWLSAHEHVLSEEGDEQRPWTTVVIDVVAAVLRGQYQVESHYRGKRLTTTRIVDVADERPREIGTTGSLFGWLPWPGEKRVEVQRVDYGLRGPSSRPPAAT